MKNKQSNSKRGIYLNNDSFTSFFSFNNACKLKYVSQKGSNKIYSFNIKIILKL